MNVLRGWPLLALGAAVVAVAWFAAPAPKATAGSAPDNEGWQLPQPAPAPAAATAQALARAPLWGRLPETPAEQAARDVPWHLLGVMRSGNERYVLIRKDGQPEQRLAINDALPDGRTIAEIQDESISVLVNGTKHKLPLYAIGAKP